MNSVYRVNKHVFSAMMVETWAFHKHPTPDPPLGFYLQILPH